MILTCPQCATRYLVPDASIGVAGRQVRCAACRHSWHQDGPAIDPSAPAPQPTGQEPPAVAPAAQAAGDPVHASYVDPSAVERPDPYGYAPPYRPRRNPARAWTVAAVAAAALMLLALGALVLFGPTSFSTRLGVGPQPVVPLNIQVTAKPQRRMMESGNELLEVTGRVINPTDTAQAVPDIRAELRDRQDRVVYSWTIARPANRLPPGGTAEFDSAAVDVPKGSSALKLSFADPVVR
ncbi:MJ0042-type zinc finger domain-containing protein [Sphingomonas jatrophae]|uniref:MJ0042 family finger-like domain-containing protein n=1 Tax=Sphingomonas jatrophae TaxID=1166337 RepID=A0A1I6LN57_9SPHN|nr:MJ0042-type zinc finger domain-containing protein [Sphingomonas jatrophae]SFS04885.1 MJ0042 family finger-like domain-containing protein [Sphingomonas jatrophae]